MRFELTSEIRLDEPSVDDGLITWFTMRIIVDDEEAEKPEQCIGQGRFALVHVGAIENCGADLCFTLDADSGELEALYGVYFDDEDCYKDEFEEGFGSDLLYIDELEIAGEWHGHNVDLAVVRRLCDTLANQAKIAVILCDTVNDVRHWRQMGFTLSVSGTTTGYMHLQMADRQPRVADPDGTGYFKILPNLSPEQKRSHH